MHCYATLDWDHGPGFKGEDGYIITDCMNMADETTEFITNEMWLLLYPFSGQNQTNKTFWVEAGITRGPPDPGHFTGPPGTQRRFYWAEDQYPSNKYTEHYPPSTDPRPVLGTPYYFKIRYAGTGAWNVFAGPTFSGTSTNTFDWGSDSLSTGSEIAASTSGAQTGSYSGGLGFFDTNGNHVAGWHQSGVTDPVFTLSSPGGVAPLYAQWVNKPLTIYDGIGTPC